MILEYTTINNIRHYNNIHLKDNYNKKDYLETIPKLLGNKYNYHYLRIWENIYLIYQT